MELPCPRELTKQGRSDEFFKKAHEIYKEFFGKENTHGTFVHKDEVHEYTGKDGAVYLSCEHAHTLVSAFSEEKGINGKAFETRSRLKSLNNALDEMCLREFDIHFNTGEKPDRKSVERLKEETELRYEADNKRKEIGQLDVRISELKKIERETTKLFLENDEKAAEAEIRQISAEKSLRNAEERVYIAEQKLKQVNEKYKVVSKELKNVLDKKARASEIHKISDLFGETQTYHKNMLDGTRAIGSEAYHNLKEAKAKLEQAVSLQTIVEQKEKAIQPLYNQAKSFNEQALKEKERQEQLRKEQQHLIEKRAKVLADEQVRQMFGSVPTSRENRLEKFCDEIKFKDGKSILKAFEEQENQLKQLQRKKSRDWER